MQPGKPGATVPEPRFGNRSAVEKSAPRFPRVGRSNALRGRWHPGGHWLIHRCGFRCGRYEARKANTLVIDPEVLWKTCSGSLRSQVAESTWRTSFEHLVPVRVDDSSVVLAAPNPLVRERIESRYLSLVRSVVEDALGYPMDIHLIVDPTAGPGGGLPDEPPGGEADITDIRTAAGAGTGATSATTTSTTGTARIRVDQADAAAYQ